MREDLAERVARLERTARRWKWAALSLALMTGAVGLLGAADEDEPKELTVRKLIVEDDAGNVRATLAPYGTGSALHLADQVGRNVLRCMVNDEGGRVEIVDPEDSKRMRAYFGVIRHRTPALELYDDEGHRRFTAIVVDSLPGSPQGGPFLGFYGADRKPMPPTFIPAAKGTPKAAPARKGR